MAIMKFLAVYYNQLLGSDCLVSNPLGPNGQESRAIRSHAHSAGEEDGFTFS